MGRTEDEVRKEAGEILGFPVPKSEAQSGVGQITTFNMLGFSGVNDKPDGWYLPTDKGMPAIILETKSEDEDISKKKWEKEIIKNCKIAQRKYEDVIGILYNGLEIEVFKNNEKIKAASDLQRYTYYLRLFTQNSIDKQQIFLLTQKINNCLHSEFGIKNLYHRMIFTACALVAKRYGATLIKGMDYSTFHTSIHSTLAKSLADSKKHNQKLDLLLEVYSEIKMNSTENQDAIDNFIDWVTEISNCVNSDYWNGEDVMGIFFNEFNRYKKKSESGQVFTPDHITSLMYRILEVNKDDVILDAACGSGAFLVKAMCNMIKEAGGVGTSKAAKIKGSQLYGIEFDREIFALACANMLIHKDGKTNLQQMDSRTDKACRWIKYINPDEEDETKLRRRPISKVLMNPPFERKYGCLTIVGNVLDSVPRGILCGFILPDKKLEKDNGAKILKHHTLKKIIKLPENLFFGQGVTASIFVFESGVPQGDKEIFGCYIEDDGLETVKNQGRQDIKDRWGEIEDYWVDIVHKQSGDVTCQWIKPSEHLSYQMPKKEISVYEEDFSKAVMDYLMFEQGINVSEFAERLTRQVLYCSSVSDDGDNVKISLRGNADNV